MKKVLVFELIRALSAKLKQKRSLKRLAVVGGVSLFAFVFIAAVAIVGGGIWMTKTLVGQFNSVSEALSASSIPDAVSPDNARPDAVASLENLSGSASSRALCKKALGKLFASKVVPIDSALGAVNDSCSTKVPAGFMRDLKVTGVRLCQGETFVGASCRTVLVGAREATLVVLEIGQGLRIFESLGIPGVQDRIGVPDPRHAEASKNLTFFTPPPPRDFSSALVR